jgi:6-phosphogluconolactonase
LASWISVDSDAEPAEVVAKHLADAMRAAIAGRGAAFVALCGGRTPRAAYAELAQQPLAWNCLTLVPTDERLVPPTHEHSNEGMIRGTLLQGAAARVQLISLWSDAPTAALAAVAATRALATCPQPFDLELLGMGEDGHIASLFPGAAELGAALEPGDGASVVAITPGPTAPPPAITRLTLSLPRLLNTRRICLLISGRAKRELLERVLQQPDRERWPVSALFADHTPPVDVMWIEGVTP